ncbi:protein kinase domain-containing protein [Cetobacterium sp.]|uniref:protein kinase domain-containing protein n=1 Tax=Cetobacterium sp. TaxID=2071632 RepID=UPI003F2A230B
MIQKIVVIDTCALMNKNTLKFISKSNIPRFCVFEESFQELKKLQNKGKNLEELKTASKILDSLNKKNRLIRVNSSATNHADAAILSRVHDGAIKKDMLIITDDKNLARDLLKTKTCKSVNYRDVYIKKVDEFGDLIDTLAYFGKQKSVKEGVKVEGSKTLIKTYIPKKNDKIKLISKEQEVDIVLPESLVQGGEGKIYFYGDLAIKIFHANKLTQERVEKLKLLSDKNITIPNVATVNGIVFNKMNDIVGYSMKKFHGKTLERVLLTLRDKDNAKEIAKNILTTINKLHKKKILMGDINPSNILVDDNNQICLIDMDSYQIDNYPCYVFKEEFLPPEFSGENIGTYMRDVSNEYFPISILLFKILMNGKHPYDQRQSEKTLSERIKTLDFKYSIDGKELENTPKGIWNSLWNELPKYMRLHFYKAFTQNEKRYTCEFWLKLLKNL